MKNFGLVENDKLLKNLGYLFNEYDIFIVKAVTVVRIDDIEIDGLCFTDGCGMISRDLSESVYKIYCSMNRISYRNIPSVIQVRLPGIKGVLIVDDNLPRKTIHVRQSMIKLDLIGLSFKDQDLPMAVLGVSKPFTGYHYLNAQVVSLLVQRGIDQGVMRAKARAYIESVRYSTFDVSMGFNLTLLTGQDMNQIIEIYVKRDLEQLWFAFSKMAQTELRQIKGQKSKEFGRIRLPVKSTFAYGASDPTSQLKANQCYISLNGNAVVGKVAVVRNPCYHPGDILTLMAVDIRLDTPLDNVLLFPTIGPRPLASDTSGGDLDGDKFIVIFDPEFIPEPVQPFDYCPENMKNIIREWCLNAQIPLEPKSKPTYDRKGLIQQLCAPKMPLVGRIDFLYQRLVGFEQKDNELLDVLVALFNLGIDNLSSSFPVHAILAKLEVQINAKCEIPSKLSELNDWFSEEIKVCLDNSKTYTTPDLKREIFQDSILDSIDFFKDITAENFVLVKPSYKDELDLLQKTMRKFKTYLQDQEKFGLVSKDVDQVAKDIGIRLNPSLQTLFYNSFDEVAKQFKVPEDSVVRINELLNLSDDLFLLRTEYDQTPKAELQKILFVRESHYVEKQKLYANDIKLLQESNHQLGILQIRRTGYLQYIKHALSTFDDKISENLNTVNAGYESISTIVEMEIRYFVSAAKLPVYDSRLEILNSVNDHQVTLIISQTGSGKSTCLPQFLLNNFILNRIKSKKIAVSQPRRKATVSLAQHLADSRGQSIGETIGYHIGKERAVTSAQTRIECVTIGILLAKATMDPSFSQYSTIFIDEVHENSGDLYLLFGIILQSLKLNKELKIVLMSATIDPEPLTIHFGAINICNIKMKRGFPIDVRYTQDIRSFNSNNINLKIDDACTEIFEIHHQNPLSTTGEDENCDILVFLPLVKDIMRACDILKKIAKVERNLVILPFYSMLDDDQKKLVINRNLNGPGTFRRVILSTNIAETSFTLSNLGFVIDSGLQFSVSRDLLTEVTTRRTIAISKSASIQRRGRVGRLGPGVCIPLYSEFDFELFTKNNISTYDDLAYPILALITNQFEIFAFPWYDRPNDESLLQTIKTLVDLGFVAGASDFTLASFDSNNLSLTAMGNLALKFRGVGLDVRQVRFLFEAFKFRFVEEAITILSFISLGITFRQEEIDEEEEEEEEGAESEDDISEADYTPPKRLYRQTSDSALLTILYFDQEWEKDNTFGGMQKNKFKRYKKQKYAIKKKLYSYFIFQELKANSGRVFNDLNSWDIIDRCLSVSMFSHIACLTRTIVHKSSISSAMIPSSKYHGSHVVIGSREEKTYGFKNPLLDDDTETIDRDGDSKDDLDDIQVMQNVKSENVIENVGIIQIEEYESFDLKEQYLYFYTDITKHGNTFFVSRLHRIKDINMVKETIPESTTKALEDLCDLHERELDGIEDGVESLM
jgi:HrpA-like RNA helicase